jgi:hypothetical protein
MSLLANHEYHCVELHRIPTWMLVEMFEFFGPAGKKWFYRGDKIYFYDQKDHMMFLLRWA